MADPVSLDGRRRTPTQPENEKSYPTAPGVAGCRTAGELRANGDGQWTQGGAGDGCQHGYWPQDHRASVSERIFRLGRRSQGRRLEGVGRYQERSAHSRNLFPRTKWTPATTSAVFCALIA